MKTIFTFSAFIFAALGYSAINVSIEYKISVSDLKAIQTQIIHCRDRGLEGMKYDCMHALKTPAVVLCCRPGLPHPSGQGCFLTFSGKGIPGELGVLRLAVVKRVDLLPLSVKIEEIQSKLASTVPVEEHLNFHNPFFVERERTNFWCQPEGEPKRWECYVQVGDQVA